MQPLTLKISSNGTLTAIYSDALAPLLTQGEAQTVRASHVEPDGQQWTADMSPVNGPILGPFPLRAQALEAETAYLESLLFE